MKDYRLSEIKKICEELSTGKERECEICPLQTCICSFLEVAPADWNIDEPSVQITDDIILAVKQTIGSFGTLDEMTEMLTLDCSDIDSIAEMIAEKFCGGEE